MTDDITTISAGQLDAVDRQGSITEQDDGENVVTTISQAYATTVEDLWNACTTTDRLARWFGQVTGDLELGGRYQIEGNASGTIETCKPPSTFRASWEFAGTVSCRREHRPRRRAAHHRVLTGQEAT